MMQTTTADISSSERERELGAIILAYNDVTERLKVAHDRLGGEVQRLREELRRKNAELRRRERLAALGEMAAGLAHEVRNPLGGIALYASMLERELGEAGAGRQAAAKISHGVRTLERLVTEILDFAQEDRLGRQVCGLRDLVSGVEEAMAPWVANIGAVVSIETPDIEVDCDPIRMHQVLVNLLLNGVQAAGRGGRAALAAGREPDGATWIEVSDNGPGIAAENLDRIFNPFFTTKATGTGLGLAIVHRIVEAHGGTIQATNRPEGGARFVVRLPTREIGAAANAGDDQEP